jgi:four helix bundle protein
MASRMHVSRAMSEQSEQLKKRTMKFALDVCALVRELSNVEPGPTVRRQLTKSATSTAANYRAACRARSHAEFTAKIGLVAEEIDESDFWLEVVAEAGLLKSKRVQELQQEAREMVAIFSKPVGTARFNERHHG